jgi:hypothetical protein
MIPSFTDGVTVTGGERRKWWYEKNSNELKGTLFIWYSFTKMVFFPKLPLDWKRGGREGLLQPAALNPNDGVGCPRRIYDPQNPVTRAALPHWQKQCLYVIIMAKCFLCMSGVFIPCFIPYFNITKRI